MTYNNKDFKCELTGVKKNTHHLGRTTDKKYIELELFDFVTGELHTPLFTLKQAKTVYEETKLYKESLTRYLQCLLRIAKKKEVETVEFIKRTIVEEGKTSEKVMKKTRNSLTRKEHSEIAVSTLADMLCDLGMNKDELLAHTNQVTSTDRTSKLRGIYMSGLSVNIY